MLSRRNLFKNAGLATAATLLPQLGFPEAAKKDSDFRFCLNTSTISGQNPGLLKYIDLTSEAGYDGIELWIRDVKQHLESGNSSQSLRKYITDRGLKVENAIGFAPWLTGKSGFEQMKTEMEMMAEIGCTRIAAPAFGVSSDQPFDLTDAGNKFKQLIELGRKTGVMPILEFWGASKVLYHIGQAMMIAAIANDPEVRILSSS